MSRPCQDCGLRDCQCDEPRDYMNRPTEAQRQRDKYEAAMREMRGGNAH